LFTQRLEAVLRVVIVNNTGSIHCQVGCGWDWSQPEHLKLAEECLLDRYGAEVQVEYIDLIHSGGLPPAGCQTEETEEEETRFPRLLINGKMKIAGDFDMRMLLDAVEVVAEMG
jgi:hypothetical protein